MYDEAVAHNILSAVRSGLTLETASALHLRTPDQISAWREAIPDFDLALLAAEATPIAKMEQDVLAAIGVVCSEKTKIVEVKNAAGEWEETRRVTETTKKRDPAWMMAYLERRAAATWTPSARVAPEKAIDKNYTFSLEEFLSEEDD